MAGNNLRSTGLEHPGNGRVHHGVERNAGTDGPHVMREQHDRIRDAVDEHGQRRDYGEARLPELIWRTRANFFWNEVVCQRCHWLSSEASRRGSQSRRKESPRAKGEERLVSGGASPSKVPIWQRCTTESIRCALATG